MSSRPKDSFAVQRLLATSTTRISIVPHYTCEHPPPLISCRLPVFTASLPASVPLWTALSLKRMSLCTILPPDWLTIDHLRKVVKLEKDVDRESFVGEEGEVRLPRHWLEIGWLVAQAQDWDERDGVKSLLEDIRNLREEKMRQSLHTISRTAMPPVDEEGSVKPLPVLDVTGVGSVEIASFRPFVKEAFRTHLSCVSAGTGVDATSELPTRWRGGTRDRDPDGLERPRALADKEATQDGGVEPPRVGEEIPARSMASRGASRLRRFRS
mmetsp:Transcript_25000/g.49703  ORF Transcript_25000/g.49703 Transcript_25000/m.49703 type:complete len:269 (-) Transcript_25000:12-818(-)